MLSVIASWLIVSICHLMICKFVTIRVVISVRCVNFNHIGESSSMHEIAESIKWPTRSIPSHLLANFSFFSTKAKCWRSGIG